MSGGILKDITKGGYREYVVQRWVSISFTINLQAEQLSNCLHQHQKAEVEGGQKAL